MRTRKLVDDGNHRGHIYRKLQTDKGLGRNGSAFKFSFQKENLFQKHEFQPAFSRWTLDRKGHITKIIHVPGKKQRGNGVGGIDLTLANMNLQTQNSDGEIKFHLDPAQLMQLQNAPGFVPVIINIQPMTDLRQFLGLDVQQRASAAS
ncbi:MAG: hypothetical protein HQL12_03775 [Candidatus Omnitrophica bacterium]|nr:hypothetical protein [Candidatus Omnitrophota bacterium]